MTNYRQDRKHNSSPNVNNYKMYKDYSRGLSELEMPTPKERIPFIL